MKSPTSSNSVEEQIRRTADYLYKIDGPITPELYQAIDSLRQLINECYVHEGKSVSSQFIYDRISPVIRTIAVQVAEKLIDTNMPAKYIQPEYALRGAQRQALPQILDEVIGGKHGTN